MSCKPKPHTILCPPQAKVEQLRQMNSMLINQLAALKQGRTGTATDAGAGAPAPAALGGTPPAPLPDAAGVLRRLQSLQVRLEGLLLMAPPAASGAADPDSLGASAASASRCAAAVYLTYRFCSTIRIAVSRTPGLTRLGPFPFLQ